MGLSVSVLTAQRSRTIDFRPGVPIASRLLANDELVIVRKPQSDASVFVEPTDAEGYIGFSVANSDSAVIARVDRVVSKWTADQSWIETELTLTPTEVLYSRITQIARGRAATLQHEFGGELQVGQCIVRAGIPLNMQAHNSYLVFVSSDDKGSLYLSRTALAIEKGRLVDTWRTFKRAGVREPLDGLNAKTVKEQIRRAAR